MSKLSSWKEYLVILIFCKTQFHKNNIHNNKIYKKIHKLKFLICRNKISANLGLLNNLT